MRQSGRKRRLLRGAREIAGRVFGDESKSRAVYPIASELPLFWLGGTMAGWSDAIDEAMEIKARQGLRRKRRQMRRP